MTENIKYKAADLTKDLKERVKDVLDVLGEKFPPKKAQATLTEEELNYVFEHFTKKDFIQYRKLKLKFDLILFFAKAYRTK